MNHTEVVIVGAGVAGRLIADRLAERKKQTRLIALNGNPEDYFRNLIETLAGRQPLDRATPGSKTCRFIDHRTLQVDDETITADHFVIASGSIPYIPAELQNKRCLLPMDALLMDPAPRAATVLGAGPIGVATAAALAKRGCAVTLLVRGDRILRKIDAELATSVQQWLESLGVRVQPPSTDMPQGPLIVATGTRANIEALDLKKIGAFVTSEGNVAVDEEMRTSTTRAHAAGAATGPIFNLEIENSQAEAVADNIDTVFFMRKRQFPEPFPITLPFETPLASIGETDGNFLSISVPFGPWKVKLVGKKRSTELVGAHAFAPGADALILYFNLLMRAGISLRDVAERAHYPNGAISDMAAEAVSAWLAAAN